MRDAHEERFRASIGKTVERDNNFHRRKGMVPFFVHIIESPSDKDFLQGRTEGRLLTNGLDIAQILFSYSVAVNREAFEYALKRRLSEGIVKYNLLPIIHFSAHGNNEGLALTNGFIGWDELDVLLSSINSMMNGCLIVSISACSGFAGCKMAMKSNGPSPFHGIIGPTEDISLSDTAISFLVFYNLLSKGVDILSAVDAMNSVSGKSLFVVDTASNIKKRWESFCKNIDEKTLNAILVAIKSTGGFK